MLVTKRRTGIGEFVFSAELCSPLASFLRALTHLTEFYVCSLRRLCINMLSNVSLRAEMAPYKYGCLDSAIFEPLDYLFMLDVNA